MAAPDQTSDATELSWTSSEVAETSRYLTIEEFAAKTTMSVSTIRRLVKHGQLIALQPGGHRHRVLFAPDAIEQMSRTLQSGGSVMSSPLQPTESVPAPPIDSATPKQGPRPRWKKRLP